MSEQPSPSWDLYGAFLAVMQTGSLSAAARALGSAQPTVRRQIEALESTLGVALFTRAPNGLVPTEVARATLPHAQAIAASAHAFVRSASAPQAANAGVVRITCSEIVGTEVLPSILARLRDKHPAIVIELALDDRNHDLLRREADVAVRMIAPTQKGLVRRRAASIELGLFATASYLAGKPTPRTLADLKAHALVGPDRSRVMFDAMAAAGLPLKHGELALRSDSTLAQLAAVRAGIGIGICQLPLARELVRVLPNVRFELEAWVVTHEDLRDVRRIRTVTDHLVAELVRYAGRKASAKPRRA